MVRIYATRHHWRGNVQTSLGKTKEFVCFLLIQTYSKQPSGMKRCLAVFGHCLLCYRPIILSELSPPVQLLNQDLQRSINKHLIFLAAGVQ